MTFRRRALATVGPFDATLETAEDLDFWVRAWTRLRWAFIERVLARQRQGTYPSASRRPGRVRTYGNQAVFLRKNRALIRSHFGDDRPWQWAYGQWATDYSQVLMTSGRRWQAVRWAAEAAARTRSPRAMKLLAESAWPGLYAVAAAVHRRVTR